MASTKFDGTEIQNSTYIPRFVQHEDAPDRDMTSAAVSADDGNVLIIERYGSKVVRLQGTLIGSSQADLESKIDTFKELFSRQEKQLDIDWNGGTRRYVASCSKHAFNRDHFNVSAVPWSAEFLVSSGIGEDTAETTVDAGTTFTTQDYNKSETLAGSATPKPRIKIENSGTTSTDACGIEIKCADNGQRLIYTRAAGLLGSSVALELDERLKTVTYNGTADSWYGVFPKFAIGANSITIRIGDIVATSFEGGTGTTDTEMPIYGGDIIKPAQSFMVPYTDTTFQGISAMLRKQGTIATDITWRIETDNAGKPSGTLADGNATGTIANAVFTDSSFDWRLSNSASKWSLTANTRYWLVLRTTGGDASNFFAWQNFINTGATYKNGNLADYQSGSGVWIDLPNNDAPFRIHFGGKFQSKNYVLKVYQYKRYL